jgi:hypothetical protein
MGWAKQVFQSGIAPIAVFANDVVRARNRAARQALETDMTHLLWWDTDTIVEDPTIVHRMLDTGCDCIGAPYPCKRIDGPWPVRAMPGPRPAPGIVTEVAMIGFGFTITSRACLERVAARSRVYCDASQDGTTRHTTRDIFDFVYVNAALETNRDGGEDYEKLSEDFSFCTRYREAGGRVHVYLGPGVPLTHAGMHGFR